MKAYKIIAQANNIEKFFCKQNSVCSFLPSKKHKYGLDGTKLSSEHLQFPSDPVLLFFIIKYKKKKKN